MAVSNGSATKAFGGVFAILALIAGVYAMIEPQGQRMDFLERQIVDMRTEMHKDDAREQQDQSQLSSIEERFKEVETQFEGLREVTNVRLNHLKDHAEAMRERMHGYVDGAIVKEARVEERVRALERVTYGTKGQSSATRGVD